MALAHEAREYRTGYTAQIAHSIIPPSVAFRQAAKLCAARGNVLGKKDVIQRVREANLDEAR
jgi:hypothetical protein